MPTSEVTAPWSVVLIVVPLLTGFLGAVKYIGAYVVNITERQRISQEKMVEEHRLQSERITTTFITFLQAQNAAAVEERKDTRRSLDEHTEVSRENNRLLKEFIVEVKEWMERHEHEHHAPRAT